MRACQQVVSGKLQLQRDYNGVVIEPEACRDDCTGHRHGIVSERYLTMTDVVEETLRCYKVSGL